MDTMATSTMERELAGEKLTGNVIGPKDVQVGGDHYKDMAIQPIEYITKNNMGYCEANVVKYISRWKSKGGVQDLEKAKHYIDLLIESTEAQRVPRF